MEWEERRAMHLKKAEEHFAKARNALELFGETYSPQTGHDWSLWDEHCKEWKLYKKECGIAKAMYTRKYRR